MNATVRQAAPWIERLARLGYAAKGIVYAIIGVLALGEAFDRARAHDSKGVFVAILRQPFGTFLLIAIAAGIAGYALWRIVESFANPEGKNVFYRAWLFSRGALHGFVVWEILQMALGNVRGEEDSAEHWTRALMAQPYGQWLAVAAGIGVGLYGFGQIVHAFLPNFAKRLRLGQVSAAQKRWITLVSRYGVAARGVVFCIVGWFVAWAAWHRNPSEARGVGGALRTVESGSAAGTWLLVIIALGLISYGAYELVKARYRRISM